MSLISVIKATDDAVSRFGHHLWTIDAVANRFLVNKWNILMSSLLFSKLPTHLVERSLN